MASYFSGNITVTINGKNLINESNLSILPGRKYIVLGINGVGKTSLINEIVSHLNDVNYLFLQQDITINENQSCLKFLLEADTKNYTNYLRLEELSLIDELSDVELEEYNVISDELKNFSWGVFESEAKKILKGLGFINPETKLTSELSGGWRMRLALGKSLLMKPDLLILDEPTNHLDMEANIWLTKYLTEYPKAIILITHDINLACSFENPITWYVGNPKMKGVTVTTIRGDYFNMKQTLLEARTELEKAYNKFENKVKEFRKSKPQKTKQQVDDYINQHSVPRPPPEYSVSIEWEEVPENKKSIISMRDISFTYGEDKLIFDKINYEISGNSRHILVGQNGVGKTTLFKLICGEVQPDSCSDIIIRDSRLRIGYYNQQIMDNLPIDLTPTQFLQSLNKRLSTADCKKILGRLSLKKTEVGDPTTVPIRNLSGGQKARVAFAKLQIDSPHLLLLDEPTNHLDMESVEALIEGINEFNGAVVIISHDLHLIKKLESFEEEMEDGRKMQLFIVGNQKINEYKGNFDNYCDMIYKSI